MSGRRHAGPKPTVSRVFADGTLVELVYNREEGVTAFAIADPKGVCRIEPYLEIAGERLAPYSPANNLLVSGCVLLPRSIAEPGSTLELVSDLRRFISRYCDLSPAFAEIAPYYVLLSWVYDAFQDLSYLRFRGDYGTGKTRALLTLGSVSYKPFFASGASTVSPIFHVLDVFRGTLVLDEADLRFSDATAQLTKILNNGTTGGVPILRTMANRHGEFDPRAFHVYGPKIVAMREAFTDRALESRFLTEETGGRPFRNDIPTHLPREFHEQAAALRDRMLGWRLQNRHRIELHGDRAVAGLEPRFNQGALALLSLMDDPGSRQRVADHLIDVQSTLRHERSSTEEADVLRVLAPRLATGDARLTTLLGDLSSAGAGQWTAKRLGWFLRHRLRLSTRRVHGNYVVPSTELTKVVAIAERFAVGEG